MYSNVNLKCYYMPATPVHVRVCRLTLFNAQDVAAFPPVSIGRYDVSLPRRAQSALRPPARDQPGPDSSLSCAHLPGGAGDV